jgi:hypothetical protein
VLAVLVVLPVVLGLLAHLDRRRARSIVYDLSSGLLALLAAAILLFQVELDTLDRTKVFAPAWIGILSVLGIAFDAFVVVNNLPASASVDLSLSTQSRNVGSPPN